MKTATFSKKLVKNVLIPAILGVGIMLSANFILSTPFDSMGTTATATATKGI
jgi:hypothetical protein